MDSIIARNDPQATRVNKICLIKRIRAAATEGNLRILADVKRLVELIADEVDREFERLEQLAKVERKISNYKVSITKAQSLRLG